MPLVGKLHGFHVSSQAKTGVSANAGAGIGSGSMGHRMHFLMARLTLCFVEQNWALGQCWFWPGKWLVLVGTACFCRNWLLCLNY